MSIFDRKKIIKDINYLDLTPYYIHKHIVEDNGLVTVLLPRFKNKILLSFVPRNRSPFVKIHLDELGSAVWLSIDGYKNVESIINALEEKLGEKIIPAEERITKFFTTLYQNKFIGFNQLNK